MVLRLAFAVSIHVDPDILIVDEALAVGDVFFTQKCFQRLREIIDAGTTFLFVSHSMAAVQNLCSRALLLRRGRVLFGGAPEEAASRYYATVSAPEDADTDEGGPPPGAADAAGSAVGAPQDRLSDLVSRADVLRRDILPRARSRHGSRRLEVLAANFLNERNEHSMNVEQNRTTTICFLLRANQSVHQASFGLHIHDRMHEMVFAAGARNLGGPLKDLAAGEECLADYRVTWSVAAGEYTISVGCSADPDQLLDDPNAGVVDDRHEGIGPVLVHADAHRLAPFYGKARLAVEVSYP